MTFCGHDPAHGHGALTICSACWRVCWTGRSASSCSRPRRCALAAGGPPSAGSRSCLIRSRPDDCSTQPARWRTTLMRPSEERPIGRCSRCATGSGCAPGKRADWARATSTRAAICSWSAAASSARAVSFRTDRGSPRCLTEQLERRHRDGGGHRCRAAVHLRRLAQRSHWHRQPDVPPARPHA